MYWCFELSLGTQEQNGGCSTESDNTTFGVDSMLDSNQYPTRSTEGWGWCLLGSLPTNAQFLLQWDRNQWWDNQLCHLVPEDFIKTDLATAIFLVFRCSFSPGLRVLGNRILPICHSVAHFFRRIINSLYGIIAIISTLFETSTLCLNDDVYIWDWTRNKPYKFR